MLTHALHGTADSEDRGLSVGQLRWKTAPCPKIVPSLDGVLFQGGSSRVWRSSSSNSGCAVRWSNIGHARGNAYTNADAQMTFRCAIHITRTRSMGAGKGYSSSAGGSKALTCKRRGRWWKLHFPVIHFPEMAANPWTHLIRKRAHLRVSILL